MESKSEYQKMWRAENKERFRECKDNWNKNNPEKVRQMKNNFQKKQREKNRVRLATWRKYGPLLPGFQYHHLKPYSIDKFVILEREAHRFYHHFPLIGSANLIGKSRGGKI